MDLLEHRPAGFYSLTFAADESVCSPVLNSVNQPHTWRTGTHRPGPDALMMNDFLINAWRHKRYVSDTPGSSGPPFVAWADQAIVDINNDGQLDAVYREEGAVSNLWFDDIILSLSPKPDELSAEILSNDRYHEIAGPPSSVDRISTNLLRINSRTIDPPGKERDIYDYCADIIKIAAQSYLIVSRSVYWKPTAVTLVFEVTDSRHLKLLCEFTGTRDIAR